MIKSVWESKLTVVPAGHRLGKDFVSGFIIPAFFLTRHPCRIVTTSVDHSQLSHVLWGEMRRFLQTSRIPLDYERGGPLILNHMHIRKVVGGEACGLSYVIGRVAASGEGMSGHHIARPMGSRVPHTLAVSDESSGVDRTTIEKMTEWAHSMLLIGNPYECNNPFKEAVKGKPGTKDRGGDIRREDGSYIRRVIRIQATDSPNVQLGLMQRALGETPTNEELVPGVLSYQDYLEYLEYWDEIKRTVGLGGDFYEGAEVKMYPAAWLDRANALADELRGRPRKMCALGIDPAEGGDRTAFVVVDEFGVVTLLSLKTPNTYVIHQHAIRLAQLYSIPDYRICFDAGGGGKQAADIMRANGWPMVRTLAFGAKFAPEIRRGIKPIRDRKEVAERRSVYKNRRAQLYYMLREALDPALGGGFAIPREYTAFRQQMEPIPITYGSEGQLELLPKGGKDLPPEKTLIGLIGHSPDETDALTLANFALRAKAPITIGSAF